MPPCELSLISVPSRPCNHSVTTVWQVLAAVSNKNILPMLGTFLAGVSKASIRNVVVVALDDTTATFARSKGAHVYLRKLVARGGSTDNHATSGLKFAVLREFIAVGCSVLLSDVDVLWVHRTRSHPALAPFGKWPSHTRSIWQVPPQTCRTWQVQNPFTLPSIHRDVDVEGMTDGWDGRASALIWQLSPHTCLI